MLPAVSPKRTKIQPLSQNPKIHPQNKYLIRNRFILKILLADGPDKLTEKDRNDWIKFLILQHVRVPAKVDENKKIGKTIVEKVAQLGQHDYENSKSPDDPPTLFEGLEQNYDVENAGLYASFFLAEKSKRAHEDINKMNWRVFNFKGTSTNLMIADDPLFLSGLDTSEAIILLPISPFHAFYADHNHGKHTPKMAKEINRIMVGKAQKYIYAIGEGNRMLIEKYHQLK